MPDSSASVVRADDLLALDFEFYNLTLSTSHGSPPQLTRITSGQPAYIVVKLPPQHLAEPAFTEDPVTGLPQSVPELPLNSVFAGESRLAFQLPDAVQSVPFTLAALLDWSSLVPSLPANALPAAPDLTAGQPAPAPPADWQTAIELPYRLLLSPDASGRWTHALSPVTRAGVTELWHTRLGALGPDGSVTETALPALRPVWAVDLPAGSVADGSGGPLDTPTRQAIVLGSGDFSPRTPGGPAHLAPPLSATGLTLSALGAWTDLRGAWSPSDFPVGAIQLVWWHQIVAQGRDQYAQATRLGTLYPLGLRAVSVAVTERKPSTARDGVSGDMLLTRPNLVVVLEPSIDYGSLPTPSPTMPLRSVRLLTRSVWADPLPATPEVIQVKGLPYQFHVVGRDWLGSPVDFSLPLLFVPDGSTYQATHDAYVPVNKPVSLRRQRVALAQEDPASSGGTTLPVDSITFDTVEARSGTPQPAAAGPPPYLPLLTQAVAQVPAVDHLLGSTSPLGLVTLGLTDPSSTPGKVFATLAAQAGLPFPPTIAGGLAASQAGLTALSAALGPQLSTAGLQSLGQLLGSGIDLTQIIDTSMAPTMQQTVSSDQITVTFTWQPTLRTSPDPLVLNQGGTSVLALKAVAVSRLSPLAPPPLPGGPPLPPVVPGPPSLTVDGSLSCFALRFPMIEISFASLAFHSETGSKTSLTPQGVRVTLQDELQFLNALADLVPLDGFDGLPDIQVTPQRVVVSYVLGLPGFGIGIFSVANVQLSVRLTLPLVAGVPTAVRVAFSERDHPFQIAVAMLGGTGFFAVEADTAGIRSLEGQVEAGANITVSLLQVVNANVHALVGFYFGLDDTTKQLTFSGYLRVGGAVDVPGIAGISIDCYLGLTYPVGGTSIVAQGSLTVGVHLLTFTKSVTLNVAHEFPFPGGSSQSAAAVSGAAGRPSPAGPGDPAFDELLSAADWETYCRAFA